jgi:hypothetical protein
MANDRGQSGYYQEIARSFLARRGGALQLSPKDLAAIASWEEKRIPLDIVLEGIERTFDGLKVRGRPTRTVSLAFCDRQVEAAFAQHRDRGAGGKRAGEAAPRRDKAARVRREIDRALESLPASDLALRRLLQEALEALGGARPNPETLERIEAGIEQALWDEATSEDKATASAEALKAQEGRRPAGFEDTVRRRAVMAVRARRRVPHVSFHFH